MPSPLPVKLFNTLTRSLEDFRPLVPGKASIYCCGPTVYAYAHIGNLRAYLFEDLLVRALRYAGYEVDHVMNITDVGHNVSDGDEGEDKMLVAAKREKKSSLEIAEYYTKVFFDDCAKLHIVRPNTVCKATEHIAEMIKLIERISANGFTYVSGGNVYFDISKLPDYGKLAQLDLEALMAGARIEVDANKKNPHDFVLWFTKSKFENQELQWDSPWGRGYPGWHIECSAMSIKYLGENFDIHCGGIDHIPVHHTNEIAQSEAAIGRPWVHLWMHGEFLVFNKEKMSKSKGGILTISALQEQGFEPLAYRYFCLGGHYRSQLNFSTEAMQGAANSLARLKSSIITLKQAPDSAPGAGGAASEKDYRKEFDDFLADDLNAPRMLATMWSVLGDKQLSSKKKLELLYAFDDVLGFGMREWKEEAADIPAEVQDLLTKREQARKDKNWPEADRLRKEISALGYVLEDSAGGAKVKKTP